MLTEEQYIAVSDLARLRDAVRILSEIHSAKVVDAVQAIYREIDKLERIVETMMHAETP